MGWLYSPETGREGRTLPAGAGRIIELPLISSKKARLLRVMLIYRFLPGELYEPDFQQIVLDRAEYALVLARWARSELSARLSGL